MDTLAGNDFRRRPSGDPGCGADRWREPFLRRTPLIRRASPRDRREGSPMKPPHFDRRRWRLLATLAAAAANACLPGEAAPPRSGVGPASAHAHRPAPAAAATGAAVP